MTETRPSPIRRRSRRPLWVVEGLDVVELRSVVLRIVVGGICAVGIALAVLAPDLVPPTPLVGAAVAVAALLLGIAAAVAVDAADVTVRGPRHIRAAGGELVAILPMNASAADADPLADAVLDAREDDQRLLLGLAAAGRVPAATIAWTDALAVAVARPGASVLSVDVAGGHTTGAGVLDVVRGEQRLSSVVSFEDDLRLARVGSGPDHGAAVAAVPEFLRTLPRDLDVLLVALPLAASRQVVTAARVLDHVLVVAERGETSRVQLIAALDAMEAAGTMAQVVLLDTRTARRLAPRDAAHRAAAESAAPIAMAAVLDSPAPAAADDTDGLEATAPADDASGTAPPFAAPDLEAGGPDVEAGGPDLEADRPETQPDGPVQLDGPDGDRGPDGPPGESGDAIGPRDVDVVLGARVAAAAQSVDAPTHVDVPGHPATEEPPVADVPPVDHVPPIVDERDLRPEPRQEPAPDGPDVVPAIAADERASGAEDGPDESETTDEIPRVRLEPDDPEVEALRTTAQLATLLDDIEQRDEERG